MSLYHYTSINALKSIIKEGQIRFTRLDLVEDIFDANPVINKLKHSNQHLNSCYIACFTGTNVEHYPLWKLYNALDGVRISVDEDVFGEIDGEIVKLKSPVNINISYFGDDENRVIIEEISAPKKVKYLGGDENEKEPDIVTVYKSDNGNDTIRIDFKEMIFLKSKFYEFENETRFAIMPQINTIISDRNSYKPNMQLPNDRYKKIKMHKKITEVMFGPRLYRNSSAVKSLVYQLEIYNPDINIKYSDIELRKIDKTKKRAHIDSLILINKRGKNVEKRLRLRTYKPKF